MGALSTMNITRTDAIRALKRAIGDLDSVPDSMISEIMETVFSESTGHNFRIVKQYDEDSKVPCEYREGYFDLFGKFP